MFENELRPTIVNANIPTPHRAAMLVWFLILVTALPMVVIELSALISIVVIKSLPYNLTYVCEGVPGDWLIEHPFNTENLPKTTAEDQELVLVAPEIEGYDFVEWKTKKNKIGAPEYITFKSNEAYTFKSTYLGTNFEIIGVYAKGNSLYAYSWGV